MGSGATAACSVTIAEGGPAADGAGATGGSTETVAPAGAASGRTSGCDARSMAAQPASTARPRSREPHAGHRCSDPARSTRSRPPGEVALARTLRARRFVFMAGGREYNTKRRRREFEPDLRLRVLVPVTGTAGRRRLRFGAASAPYASRELSCFNPPPAPESSSAPSSSSSSSARFTVTASSGGRSTRRSFRRSSRKRISGSWKRVARTGAR